MKSLMLAEVKELIPLIAHCMFWYIVQMIHDTVAAIHIMPTCGMHSLPIQRIFLAVIHIALINKYVTIHRVPIQGIFLLLSVAMTPTFNCTKEYPGSYMYVPIAIMHGLPGARVGSSESLSLGISERPQCIDQRNFHARNFLTAFHIQQLCNWCIVL